MKRKLPAIFLCFCIASVLQAQTVRLFYEKSTWGYTLYANNTELYPVSVSVDLDLQNMHFSPGKKKIFVVPPRQEKFKIGDLSPINSRNPYKFNYKFLWVMGDVTITGYDTSFRYDLPYKKGAGYKVIQGYNGNFSHKNEHAIDFDMTEGTEIVAAREGIVVKIVQHHFQSCPTEDCEQYNNYITIMHGDGSYASYIHIKNNGAAVKAGDAVRKGDVIAYSGNVGWTTAPHLHFVCFLGAFGKRTTIPTVFKVDQGTEAIILTSGNTYIKNY